MDNILGKRIKLLRNENSLTQEEFGKPYNLKKSTISQYESGFSKPDDELKKRIANDFNVTLDWLMGLTDIRNPYKPETQDKTLKQDILELMIRHGITKDKNNVDEKHLEFIEFAIEEYKNEKNNKK